MANSMEGGKKQTWAQKMQAAKKAKKITPRYPTDANAMPDRTTGGKKAVDETKVKAKRNPSKGKRTPRYQTA